MQPLNKVQAYAEQNDLKYNMQMRTDPTTDPPQLSPVFSTQLTPDLFLAYMQDDLDSGTLLIQHLHRTQVTQAIFREIKNSRKLNIENEIMQMREDILTKQESTTELSEDADESR